MASITKDPYFQFTPLQNPEGKMLMKIEFGYQILTAPPEETGVINGYIPGMEIFFYTANAADVSKVSAVSMKSFVRHIIKDDGLTGLFQKLKVMGFNPSNGVLDWNKIKKKTINSPMKFSLVNQKKSHGEFNSQPLEMLEKVEFAY